MTASPNPSRIFASATPASNTRRLPSSRRAALASTAVAATTLTASFTPGCFSSSHACPVREVGDWQRIESGAMDLQRFALALGASAAIATGVARSASTYDQYGVEDMLAHLPQIQSEHPIAPNGNFKAYRIKGTGLDGYVDPGSVNEVTLANKQELLIVPLQSGGAGATFAALVWIGPSSSWHYAGYLSSPDGHLRLFYEGGYILAERPVYAPADAQSRPSAYRITRYTADSKKIIEMDSIVLPRAHELPKWLYFDPGTRAYLGTNGQDAPVAIVCPNAKDYANRQMSGCTDRDE